jgi:1-deoxy-D-xylulose 5-phosphate reductoisomerase
MTEAAVRERPVTSRQIKVGDVPIGGGAPVAVQSMTNTMTYDVEATVQQVYDLNAANEVAVEAFLDGRIQFLSIPDVIEEVLEAVPDFGAMNSMESITAVDVWARQEAGRLTGGTRA